MYKILLADDEGIVIDSLRFVIEKEFGDSCLVEHAKTGRSVIELAEQFRPDIAVMDIQMPGINGIEAMKEIRESNQKVVFIIMSAYDKFDFAKEAIKVGGVLEYLTKPMERSKITTALKQAMELVDKERERKSHDLMMKEKMEIVVPIIESGLIYNILFQEYFTDDVDYYKQFLGIPQDYGYMLALVFGEEQQGNHMTNAVGSSVKMQSHYQEVRECVKESFDGIIGTVMANKIAVLIPCGKSQFDYQERIELIEKARELVRRMRKKIGIRFRIGIGGVRELRELPDSYQEALSALVHSTGTVAHVDDLPLRCDYEEDYPIQTEKKLFGEIEKGRVNAAVSTAGIFFDWMARQYPESMMDIRLKVLEFVLWTEHLAYEKGGMTYQFKNREEYLPALLAMNDLAGIRNWFVEKIAMACRNIVSKRREKSDSLVETAKNYIESNFQKDLSLDEVSRKVDVSPYYFSKIFKEGTGQNFVEYLTRVRMEKAKELLWNTGCSMKEICMLTGYSEPNYFSRSFKKNVGVTPTEYKEGKAVKYSEKRLDHTVEVFFERKRCGLLLAFFLFVLFFLSGCGKSYEDGSKSAEEEEDKIQIGMAFDSFVIERWQRDRDVFVSMAKELGAQVNVQNANGDVKEQKKQIEYFVDQGMDVIVIICIDSQALKDTVRKARESGIKVIAYDRLICDTQVDLYISFDNEEVGRLMGEALVEQGAAGGNVIMLGGPLTDHNVSLVESGFKEVMEANHINIVGGMHAEGWRAEQASAYIYENMTKAANADAIMCGNDNIASAVVRALSEKRMAGSVLVVGQDADLEACQRIVEGTQTMTVYKPVEKLAKAAAEYAVRLAEGETLDDEKEGQDSDGGTFPILKMRPYRVPYVALKPYSVTAESMEEIIIDSGFHLKEDVYLNVPYKM